MLVCFMPRAQETKIWILLERYATLNRSFRQSGLVLDPTPDYPTGVNIAQEERGTGGRRTRIWNKRALVGQR